MYWDDGRTERLVQMWRDGMSASKIAAELGGVSRNAVIGKIHRLKVSSEGREASRPKPAPKPASTTTVDRRKIVAAGRAAAKIQVQKRFPDMEAAPVLEVVEPYVLPETTHFGQWAILGLGDTDTRCKWPIGDPLTSEFRFCCAGKGNDGAYCSHHARMAYQTTSVREAARRVA